MVKARVIEQAVTLYEEPNFDTPLVEVPAGDDVEIGAVKRSAGKQWVAVSLNSGRKGYIPGDAKVFTIKPATLLQDEVNVHVAPSADSRVVIRYQKDARFDLIDQVNGDGGAWVKIRDSAGNEGFIDGKTRVRTGEPGAGTPKEIARKNIGVGAAWCLGGILITALTYASASQSGGTYFVMWGPMVFGAWQFLKGLAQYLTAD